jgi:hypothetical protein
MTTNAKPPDPAKIYNLRDLASYIAHYSDRIFVLEDSKKYALSELPGDRAIWHAMAIVQSGKVPNVAS